MRYKANIFSAIAIASLIFVFPVYSSNELSIQQNNQIIKSILEKEKKAQNRDNIINIVNLIDATYGNLYERLKSGEKITIFFDPAHGRLDSGKWQGEVTGRLSSSGIPEEAYSINFSRKLYKLLSANKYFRIVTNDDYKKVLNGESTEYKKIFFSETVKVARSEKAFMIISQHLNNISSLQKADGIVNLPGIHVTCDESGNRYLAHLKTSHNGYLTLYNKYDLTGFSKYIAYNIIDSLTSKGISINNWDYGAVADDRFSYFIDFPISMIFEQGFICNPVEEEKLRDPDYQQKIVDSQYIAILESFKNIFGIDISGLWLSKLNDNTELIDLIKLSRIAIYYLQNDYTEKAVSIINEMENNTNAPPDLLDPYINLKERIIKAERYFKKCKDSLNAGKNKEAKNNLYNAVRTTGYDTIFYSQIGKYSNFAKKHFGIYNIASNRKGIQPKISMPYNASKASLNTPVILAIEKNQTLEDAVDKALSTDPKTTSAIVKSLNEVYTRKKVKVEEYSEKTKKTATTWKYEKKKVEIKEGIYIVSLKKNLQVRKLERIWLVMLDPYKYQNHQYLKNSYFAGITKQKTL